MASAKPKKSAKPSSKRTVTPAAKKAQLTPEAKSAKSAANKAAHAKAQAVKNAAIAAANKLKRAATSEAFKQANAAMREIYPPIDPRVVQGDKPRPTTYTRELGEKICLMFALDPNMTLIGLNAEPELPTVYTLYAWLRDNAHFSKVFTLAREVQAAFQAEELEKWARNPLLGEVETRRVGTTEKGHIDVTEIRRSDNVERAKLMVSTRQWRLAKLHPKVYGTKEAEQVQGPSEQLVGLFEALKAGPVEPA